MDGKCGNIHDKMVNKLFVASTTRNKMPPEKQPWGRLRQKSEVFFPLADHAIVAHHVVPLSHQAFVLALSRVIQIFDSAIVTSDKVWRTSTLFASPFWFLRNIALPITN